MRFEISSISIRENNVPTGYFQFVTDKELHSLVTPQTCREALALSIGSKIEHVSTGPQTNRFAILRVG